MKLLSVTGETITGDDVVRFRVELPLSARILGARFSDPGNPVKDLFRIHLLFSSTIDDRTCEHEFLVIREGARYDLPVNNAVVHTEFTGDHFLVVYHLGPVV